MNEELLINEILSGNTSAFAYFVDTYQDMAVTIAYRISGNKQDAEDIVQNAFVKVYHNLHAFRFGSKFSTWFYRIVYNTALSYVNSSLFCVEFTDYQQISEEDCYSEWDTLEQIQGDELKTAINDVLERMPRGEGLLLSLYYLEENSIKDISRITGLNESNVKVKLHRARKRFGEMLGPLDGYKNA
jgi:RNA polymerase sigma-70 factor (ECF subfamily)